MNLLDSHDTPRFLSMVGGDTASLRLATLIQMTMPGAPSIYYGDEIGMSGEQDPGCRGAFPWQDEAAWDRELLAFISGAIALRNDHPVLRRGGYRTVAASGQVAAYLRSDERRGDRHRGQRRQRPGVRVAGPAGARRPEPREHRLARLGPFGACSDRRQRRSGGGRGAGARCARPAGVGDLRRVIRWSRRRRQ